MSEPTQPKSCFECGCPLAGKAKGFTLGCGDPRTAKYAIILEAPGKDEVAFSLKPNPARSFLSTGDECDRELAIRKRDYAEIDSRYIRLGVPVVGATGAALQFWVWPKLGIKREECYIDNTIRCLPPKGKNGEAYPTGEDRKEAEKLCRQYDRIGDFKPDVAVVSIHPASILREITPLPLLVKDFEKVRDFTSQSRRVVTLLGGKAAHAFLRYASNVTKWRGHYAGLPGDWCETYKSNFDYQRKRKVKEKVKMEITSLEACKKWKRYRGGKVPTCGCLPCWYKYHIKHKETV